MNLASAEILDGLVARSTRSVTYLVPGHDRQTRYKYIPVSSPPTSMSPDGLSAMPWNRHTLLACVPNINNPNAHKFQMPRVEEKVMVSNSLFVSSFITPSIYLFVVTIR